MTISIVINSVKRISVFQKFFKKWATLKWHPKVLHYLKTCRHSSLVQEWFLFLFSLLVPQQTWPQAWGLAIRRFLWISLFTAPIVPQQTWPRSEGLAIRGFLFFHKIKCNRMTTFTEFMLNRVEKVTRKPAARYCC